jgi:predicted peptidase
VHSLRVIAAVTLIWCSYSVAYAQAVVDGFDSRTFTAKGGAILKYRIFTPRSNSAGPLPAIVYLHGSGGAGTDNLAQISRGNKAGTHVWTTSFNQGKYPAFVVAPQISAGDEWASNGRGVSASANLVIELIEHLGQELPIDMDRIYLVGQSLGGFGTWDLVSKRPDFFAAAIPLCGGGDPSSVVAGRRLPVWAFHGAKDQVVPVERSRELVAALRQAGGIIRYTEYADTGHDVWTRAFAEPDLPGWLFTQKRTRSQH